MCVFIATRFLLKMREKARRWGYGFELYAGMKFSATQELSQKVAAITYSEKLWSGKRILAQVEATLRGFAQYLPPAPPGGLTKQPRRKQRSHVYLTLPVYSSFAKELK